MQLKSELVALKRFSPEQLHEYINRMLNHVNGLIDSAIEHRTPAARTLGMMLGKVNVHESNEVGGKSMIGLSVPISTDEGMFIRAKELTFHDHDFIDAAVFEFLPNKDGNLDFKFIFGLVAMIERLLGFAKLEDGILAKMVAELKKFSIL